MARRRARQALALGLVLLAVAAVGVFAGSRSSGASAGLQPLRVPAPARPAFVIPKPRGLRAPAVARWAPVVRPAVVRAKPLPRARPIARLSTRTPEGTANVVDVSGRAADGRSSGWVAVRVAGLPENLTGWVPRTALGGYTFVHTRLVVGLEARTAELVRDGRTIFHASIGIGKASSPTPIGDFYVRSRIWSLGSSFYGPLAFGTSARSPTLTDWPGGGFIGIHGTNQPELIPGEISHGCIRMRNEDILELGRLMPVGTPVSIR
jgi:hypothetical protein